MHQSRAYKRRQFGNWQACHQLTRWRFGGYGVTPEGFHDLPRPPWRRHNARSRLQYGGTLVPPPSFFNPAVDDLRLMSRTTLTALLFIPIISLFPCLLLASDASEANEASSSREFYESQVLPILETHCLECHSHRSGKARGGLVLDSTASLVKGGDLGPAIVPGDVDSSLLVAAIRYQSSEIEMPPEGKLPEKEIKILTEWVRRGAPIHADNVPFSDALRSTEKDGRSDRHWAFQPLIVPDLPSAVASGSAAIDYLVEQARRSADVSAVTLAEKRTVVQRLYSDLHGLPPTPEELDQDVANVPVEDIVQRLLVMPEFGERWGRHWLDVARYADSNGCSIESNNTHDNAWRYRDYVIAALNQDKPYDRFVMEQIAGDLLDYVSSTQRCEQLIASGFLLLGPKAFGSGFDQLEMDVIDEQIDTVGKAMLGMSLGCARCHDHKFDPVSTEDYYALAGIFSSTQSVGRKKGWRQGKSWNRVELPVLDAKASTALKQAYARTQKEAEAGDLVKEAEARLAQAKQALQEARKNPETSDVLTAAEEALAAAQREMFNARNMKKVLPVISPVPVAMAVTEKTKMQNQAVRIRGEIGNRGQVVARRVPALMHPSGSQAFEIPEDESGRIQLAQWLVDVENGAGALLARVAVNRIWGHLFARPLVDSPDNFGTTGSAPSHPALLDYLAWRFIQSGWSTRSLIRDIVLTQTYRLAAVEHSANSAIDPSNLWLWRYQPKRIDVEVLRDSMLAISGQLDRTRGGKTLQHLGLVSLGGDHLVLEATSPYRRRSVYMPIYRDTVGLTQDVDASMALLSVFDFADPNLMAGSRSQTVVPAQALFLMNAEFVHSQSRALAQQLMDQASDSATRIQQICRKVYGRPASTEEIRQLETYVANFLAHDGGDEEATNQPPTSERELAAWTSVCQSFFGSNEFLFLD